MSLGKKLAFIGAGNMGEALVKGLLSTGACTPDEIWVSARRPSRVAEMAKTYGVHGADNRTAARNAEIVVLAVKPQILDKVVQEIAPVLSPSHLVVSIAAGVPIAAIERRLHKQARIVRAMPNTPAVVRAAATAVARGEHATEADLDAAVQIFNAVGKTIVVDEYQMDAVTGLSGSGPAYVFLMLEALADAGVKVGLARYEATALAAQTLYGAAKLALEMGLHPAQLRDQVTSPAGTTASALHKLEAGGLRTTLIDAVEAAARRSRELGEEFMRKLEREEG